MMLDTLTSQQISRRKLLQYFSGLALANYALVASAQAESFRASSALLIGNSNYKSMPLLAPAQDVQLMGKALEKFGFETSRSFDLAQAEMIEVVRQWIQRTERSCVRLFYYSGHGASFRGGNYLVPIDAKLQTPEDLPSQAFKLDDIIDRLSRQYQGVNVVVVDACRNTPTRGLDKLWNTWNRTGFVQSKPARGSFIAFATSPGAVAVENLSEGSSLYTRCLVKELGQAEQSIEAVFKNARAEVIRLSAGKQVPIDTSTIVGDYQFNAHFFSLSCNGFKKS